MVLWLFLMGLLVAAILSFVTWISSLGLYALGEIVENSDHVKRTSQKQVDILEEIAKELKGNAAEISLPEYSPKLKTQGDSYPEKGLGSDKTETDASSHTAKAPRDEDTHVTADITLNQAVSFLNQVISFNTEDGRVAYIQRQLPKLPEEVKELLAPLANSHIGTARSIAETLLKKLS